MSFFTAQESIRSAINELSWANVDQLGIPATFSAQTRRAVYVQGVQQSREYAGPVREEPVRTRGTVNVVVIDSLTEAMRDGRLLYEDMETMVGDIVAKLEEKASAREWENDGGLGFEVESIDVRSGMYDPDRGVAWTWIIIEIGAFG